MKEAPFITINRSTGGKGRPNKPVDTRGQPGTASSTGPRSHRGTATTAATIAIGIDSTALDTRHSARTQNVSSTARNPPGSKHQQKGRGSRLVPSTAKGQRAQPPPRLNNNSNKEQRSNTCVASTAAPRTTVDKATAGANRERNGPSRRMFTLSDHILLNAKPVARSTGCFPTKKAPEQRHDQGEEMPAAAWSSDQHKQQPVGTSSPDWPELGFKTRLNQTINSAGAASPSPAHHFVDRTSTAFGKVK